MHTDCIGVLRLAVFSVFSLYFILLYRFYSWTLLLNKASNYRAYA